MLGQVLGSRVGARAGRRVQSPLSALSSNRHFYVVVIFNGFVVSPVVLARTRTAALLLIDNLPAGACSPLSTSHSFLDKSGFLVVLPRPGAVVGSGSLLRGREGVGRPRRSQLRLVLSWTRSRRRVFGDKVDSGGSTGELEGAQAVVLGQRVPRVVLARAGTIGDLLFAFGAKGKRGHVLSKGLALVLVLARTGPLDALSVHQFLSLGASLSEGGVLVLGKIVSLAVTPRPRKPIIRPSLSPHTNSHLRLSLAELFLHVVVPRAHVVVVGQVQLSLLLRGTDCEARRLVPDSTVVGFVVAGTNRLLRALLGTGCRNGEVLSVLAEALVLVVSARTQQLGAVRVGEFGLPGLFREVESARVVPHQLVRRVVLAWTRRVVPLQVSRLPRDGRCSRARHSFRLISARTRFSRFFFVRRFSFLAIAELETGTLVSVDLIHFVRSRANLSPFPSSSLGGLVADSSGPLHLLGVLVGRLRSLQMTFHASLAEFHGGRSFLR